MPDTPDCPPSNGTADGTYLDELDAWQASEPDLTAAIKTLAPDAIGRVETFRFYANGTLSGGGLSVLWAKEHPKFLQVVLRDGLNRSVLVTHNQNGVTALKAENAQYRETLVEVVGCFDAAAFEGWQEALDDLPPSDAADRVRDLWARRIAYANAAAQETLALLST